MSEVGDKPDLRLVLQHYGIDVSSMRREVLVRCPVHDEDRASCSVNLDDGLFNCHACSASGDAWTLIMKREGFDEFRDAVEFAVTKFGWQGSTEPRSRGAKRTSGRGAGFRPSYRRRSALNGG